MTNRNKPITILLADDDPDELPTDKGGVRGNHLANDLRFVEDGQELMDYLHQRGKTRPRVRPDAGIDTARFEHAAKGRTRALQEIKADPRFRNIRVVVMTTSKAEEDVVRSYDLSAASYITKPVTFERLVDVIKTLGKYWLEIVELPPQNGATNIKTPPQ